MIDNFVIEPFILPSKNPHLKEIIGNISNRQKRFIYLNQLEKDYKDRLSTEDMNNLRTKRPEGSSVCQLNETCERDENGNYRDCLSLFPKGNVFLSKCNILWFIYIIKYILEPLGFKVNGKLNEYGRTIVVKNNKMNVYFQKDRKSPVEVLLEEIKE